MGVSNWTQIQNMISTGNDVSDNLDTAFGNIDNDLANKDASITQNAIDIANVVNGSTQVDRTSYKELTTEPTYTAGNVFFKDNMLNIHNGLGNTTLNVGREMYMEVVNNTGSTITNGSVVSHDGVAAGKVQIKLAIADTYTNAKILGVATHDIANGAIGLITTFGIVSDIDTASYTTGIPLYLSDANAGGLTDVAPDIATQVGGVITADATTGKLFVSINNTITLPSAVAIVKGQTSGSYSLTANTPTIIDNYANSLNVISAVDATAGTIGVVNKGVYRFTFEFSGTLSDEEIDMTIELYDVTNGAVVESFTFTSGRASNPSLVPMSHTLTRPFNVPANNTVYVTRVISATDETLVLNDCSFTLESIHIR